MTEEQRAAIHARAKARGSHYLQRKARNDAAFAAEVAKRNARDRARFEKTRVSGGAQRILNSVRYRARKKNLVCTLTLDDLQVPAVCPVLGIPLQPWGFNNGLADDSPSIDRIDPAGGYTRENIRIISWRANKIKSDATLEELRAVLSYVEREHSSSVRT